MRTSLRNPILLALWLLVATAFFSAGCSGEGRNANTPAGNAATTAPTPSNKITAADVAKLKWIEATWKGEGDENPFYERYRFEGTTMVVESLGEDGKVKTDGDTTR